MVSPKRTSSHLSTPILDSNSTPLLLHLDNPVVTVPSSVVYPRSLKRIVRSVPNQHIRRSNRRRKTANRNESDIIIIIIIMGI